MRLPYLSQYLSVKDSREDPETRILKESGNKIFQNLRSFAIRHTYKLFSSLQKLYSLVVITELLI